MSSVFLSIKIFIWHHPGIASIILGFVWYFYYTLNLTDTLDRKAYRIFP